MKERNMTAIILAGGKSTRMRENKALLSVGGQRLIERVGQNLEPYFREILVSAQEPDVFDFLPYRVALDEQQGQGPMMGILTGLKASKSDINFVIGCDIPDIDITFLKRLAGYTWDYDIVVPLSGRSKYEPLFAFYNKSVTSSIDKLLSHEQRQIIKLFHICRTKLVAFDNNGWYHNLNTLADYRRYLEQKEKNAAPSG